MMRSRHAAALAAAVSALAFSAGAAGIDLRLVPDTPARCLDGSAPGYYHAAATCSTSSNKWVIHLEGGGECSAPATCGKQLKTALGSSDYFAREIDDMPFLVSGSPAENPHMHDWNRVWVKYCSQDLWSGTGGDLAVTDTVSVRFHGHEILEAVLVDLGLLAKQAPDLAPRSMDRGDAGATRQGTGTPAAGTPTGAAAGPAEEIVLTGESAGGLGTFANLQWLADAAKPAAVTGAVIAGFYDYAYPYRGPGNTGGAFDFSNFQQEGWRANTQIWKSFLHPACVDGVRRIQDSVGASESDPSEAFDCMVPRFSNHYIDADLFMFEADTDRVQMIYHDWVNETQVFAHEPDVNTYVSEWRANMTRNLHNTEKRRGFFSPACWIHTDFSTLKGPFLNGKAYSQAFQDWYAASAEERATGKFRTEDGETVANFGGKCVSSGERGVAGETARRPASQEDVVYA